MCVTTYRFNAFVYVLNYIWQVGDQAVYIKSNKVIGGGPQEHLMLHGDQ